MRSEKRATRQALLADNEVSLLARGAQLALADNIGNESVSVEGTVVLDGYGKSHNRDDGLSNFVRELEQQS